MLFLPFPIFDLVHVKVILSDFLYRWTAFTGNFFTGKRTAFTRTAYYPVIWLPGQTLYPHVHRAYLSGEYTTVLY